MKFLNSLKFVVLGVTFLTVVGCSLIEEFNDIETPKEAVRRYQNVYHKPFEVIESVGDQRTSSGRTQYASAFLRSVDEDVKFRVGGNSTNGTTMDGYIPARLGKSYSDSKLKPLLDKAYGVGNYRIAVFLHPSTSVYTDAELTSYDPSTDEGKRFTVYLAIKSQNPSAEVESQRLLPLVESIIHDKKGLLEVGYFPSFPSDSHLDKFLFYYSQSLTNTFTSFFGESMSGSLGYLAGHEYKQTLVEYLKVRLITDKVKLAERQKYIME